MSGDRIALALGADVVQRLIPHRRPLLMVDAVEAFRRAPEPTLWARRHVSANESVFDGHFPGLHLWPGIYTIEGLGQTSLLLGVVLELVAAAEARGETADAALAGLRQVDRSYALRPTSPPAALDVPVPRAGASGHVDVKLLAPVYAGQLIRYRATLTHRLDDLSRFDVEATVDNTCVARGTMTGAAFPSPRGGP